MISPISSQTNISQMDAASTLNKANKGATKPSSTTTVDSPVNENHEPPSEELKEAPAQKAAEAMRALASRESTGSQATSQQTIINPQTVTNAYLNSTK